MKSESRIPKAIADRPALFGEVRQPTNRYLVIPTAFRPRGNYIPMAFFDPDVIVSAELFTIEGASNWHFGVLSSNMHMAWVRQVAERLKSDFRYSSKLVYNNYPWPDNPTEKGKAAVEAKAQAVLDARAAFPDSSLADLYDPLSMPVKLSKAHAELDRAVDACYRDKPFHSDRERVEFLFERYEMLTAPLTAGLDKKQKRKRKSE